MSGVRLLEVRSLSGGYGQAQVLHDLDFHVDAGEIVVILGANGAGKTTTLRALSGMIRARGRVSFGGADILGESTPAMVAMGLVHVPQGRGTFAELSVEDNLRVGAYVRRDRREVESDIGLWYEVFPVLGQRRRQAAGSLSGGEQQMLAIARAQMSRPRMLLLDEPSLGLAPKIVLGLFERLAAIRSEQGTTMLLVEQNAQLSLRMADRGYVLESGRIAVHGSAQQLMGDDSVRRAYLGV